MLERKQIELLFYGEPDHQRRFTQDFPVLPDVWITREWVRAHTTARTIGGLASGTYVVSGSWSEVDPRSGTWNRVDLVPSRVEIRADELSLISIHRP